MAAGDKVAGVYFGNRLPCDGPVGRRRDRIFRGKILCEGLAARQRRISQRTPRSWIRNFCVSGLEPFRRDVPFLGGNLDEQIARGGGIAGKLRSPSGRGGGAEASGIEWSTGPIDYE